MAAPSEVISLPTLPQRVARRIRLYKTLCKWGITVLVAITVSAGYLAGHALEKPLNWQEMIGLIVGVCALTMASASLNQIQEWKIDRKMPRTKDRPIPSGEVSLTEAKVISVSLFAIGAAILAAVSTSALLLSLAAALLYNGLYTLWWKPKWAFAAVPGAIPGALPVLIGYSVSSGSIFSAGGLYLFSVQFFWQMPHFWSLAIRYSSDYKSGDVPTLPVTHGAQRTYQQIVIWNLAYAGIVLLAPLFLDVGPVYLCVSILMSAKLLWELKRYGENVNGRQWLHYFLWITMSLLVFLLGIVIDRWSVYLLIPFA